MVFGIELRQEQLDVIDAIKTRYLAPGVVIPILLIATLGWLALSEFVIPWICDRTAFTFVQDNRVVNRDPIKTPVKKDPFVAVGTYGRFYAERHAYTITPLYDYVIEARVLHKRRYHSDDLSADLIPFDVGLGWQLMSDAGALRDYMLFHHESMMGGRFLSVELRGDWRDVPPQYLQELQAGRYYSNNHLIPADDSVFDAIDEMSVGDIVRLKGYLVDLARPDTPGWQWNTSKYARSDAQKNNTWGGGWTTCDTMYVTEAVVLP